MVVGAWHWLVRVTLLVARLGKIVVVMVEFPCGRREGGLCRQWRDRLDGDGPREVVLRSRQKCTDGK